MSVCFGMVEAEKMRVEKMLADRSVNISERNVQLMIFINTYTA